jgi:4-amino-4-deoxy-L-arabinose transferase-like glycosyltransferase
MTTQDDHPVDHSEGPRGRPLTKGEASENEAEVLGGMSLTRTRLGALLILILAVGLVLRLHDYTAAPRSSENVDGLAWAWAGLSLLQDHSPTSWSYLPSYPHHFPLREPDNGRMLPGVHNWLDHPPLFALLIGGFAWLAGERQFAEVSNSVIRLPVIALSLVTLLLCFLLGRRLLGRLPALLATSLLAVAPGAVLGSRVVESEALLAPLLLLALLLLHRLLADEGGRVETVLLLLVCAIAPMVKVPGASFGVIVGVVLALRGRRRLAGLALAMTGLGVLAYAGYGLTVGWREFLGVILAQAGRHGGLLSGYEFIVSPAGFSDAVQLHDGWWLLGWLAVALVASLGRARGADLLLAWPLTCFAITIMLMADVGNAYRYGWYRLAVYPLAYLAAADLVVSTIRRPTLVQVALVVTVPGATATLALWGRGGGLDPAFLLLDLLVLIVLVCAGIVSAAARHDRGGWRSRWPQLAAGAAVALILVLNVAQSFRLGDVYRSL